MCSWCAFLLQSSSSPHKGTLQTINNVPHIGCQDEEKPSFADLPRELRDMVYADLWSATPLLRPSFGRILRSNFVVYYGHTTIDTSRGRLRYGLPKWLQLSRGICHEGIEELRRRATWSCWLESCRDLDDQTSALIGPASATRAIWNSMGAEVRLSTQSEAIHATIVTPAPTQPLMAIATRLGTDVRHLTLHFQHNVFHYSNELDTLDTWSVDLSLFDQLDLHLDPLTFVAYLLFAGEIDPQRHTVALRTAYETETNRLASTLLRQHHRINVNDFTMDKDSYYRSLSITSKATRCKEPSPQM